MNTTQETAKTNEPKGVFIPLEILKMDLKADEKIVLSVIAYYTEKGKKHACFLTNQKISDLTGISYYVVRDRIKPTLIEKGFITTNGGIKQKSTLNLYRQTTIGETESISSNNDTNLYRQTTIGEYREMTIQNKEEKIKENKDINLESINKEPLNTEKLINEKSTNFSSDYINNDLNNESVKECTCEKSPLFNFNREFDGLNEKLMQKAPYTDVTKLNHSQRKECIGWFWGKWNAYKKLAKTSRISFDEANQYNRTFLHLAKTYFNGEVLKEVRDKLNAQITSIMRNLIMENWKLFLNSLNHYSNSECKRIRLKFESVTDFFFSDCENYNAVCDIMANEYLQAWGNRQQTFNLSTVDELFNGDYTLNEALETLKNSNLSKDDIKRRWNDLNSATCEVSDILPTATTQYCDAITNGDMIEWGLTPNVDYTEF